MRGVFDKLRRWFGYLPESGYGSSHSRGHGAVLVAGDQREQSGYLSDHVREVNRVG